MIVDHGRKHDGRGALDDVNELHEEAPLRSKDAKHIGAADVATPLGSNINAESDLANKVPRRDRPHQVTRDHDKQQPPMRFH